MKKISIYLIALFVAFTWSSCSEYLDINEDPNNPLEGNLAQLLPSVQVDIAGALGMATGGASYYGSVYMHQLVTRDDNDYNFNGDQFGVTVPWEILYNRALQDISEIIATGTEEEAWHYVGMAQILKAYVFSVLVDLYGDVPFSEANLGTDNLSPSYDDDEQVYNGVFVLLDEGVANLEKESILSPGSEDLIYDGDTELWTRFVNTLKLKLYTQLRDVRDVSSDVQALLDEDMLLEEGDDFELVYGASVSPDDRNPAYRQEYNGNPRYYISPFFYEIMSGRATFFPAALNPYLNIRDPRIPYYFYNQIEPDEFPENPCAYCFQYVDGNGNVVTQVPELEGTGFVGIYTFSFNIDPNEGFDQASSQTITGLYPVGGAYDDGSAETNSYSIGAPEVPQRMLTYYARKFLEAELYITGVADGDATAAFEEAVLASFDKVNSITSFEEGAPEIEGEELDDYVSQVMDRFEAADDEGKLRQIMTQKWIASFGWGVDPYTDYRRTGYPLIFDGNSDFLDVTVRGREFPFSWPYPQESLELNPSSPAQKQVTSPSARVFWDID
jgi:hypothetical protein